MIFEGCNNILVYLLGAQTRSRMVLPLLTAKRRLPILLGAYTIFSVLYLFAGHVQIRSPVSLSLTLVDEAIGFVDWTIFIYLSQLGIICSPYVLHDDYLSMNETLYAMLIATGIAFAIFMIFPTTLPRDSLNPGTHLAPLYAQLHAMDKPVNCFPSLHVTLAHLAWTTYLRARGPKLAVIFAWAMLITVSTLTTKQHYFVDVLGGWALAAISLALAKLLVRRLMAEQLPTQSTGSRP